MYLVRSILQHTLEFNFFCLYDINRVRKIRNPLLTVGKLTFQLAILTHYAGITFLQKCYLSFTYCA